MDTGFCSGCANRNYNVQIEGNVTKRHEDQLRPCVVSNEKKSIPPLNPLRRLPRSENLVASPIPESKTPDNSVNDTNQPDVQTAELPAEKLATDPVVSPNLRASPSRYLEEIQRERLWNRLDLE